MNSVLRKIYLLCTIFGVIALMTSCVEDEPKQQGSDVSAYGNQVVLRWGQMHLLLDQWGGGYRPGASARTEGLVNYAVYEACIPGMPKSKSLARLYPELKLPSPPAAGVEMQWEIVCNSVYKYMNERLYYRLATSHPNIYNQIQVLYNDELNLLSKGVSNEVIERSKLWGEDVARAVFEWSKTDAFGHDVPRIDPSYQWPIFPGSWRPTFPDFTSPFFPHWGKVRTFAAVNSTLVSPKPIPYSTDPNSDYYKEGLEVYNAVNQIKANGAAVSNDEHIAWFWSDDIGGLMFSPPARMIAIANQLIEKERFNLEQAVVFYAKLGAASNDIAVAVWKNKYIYNTERPITYIREVLKAQYPDAANWTTILDNIPAGVMGVTPPFPAYPSGHSGFGGGMDVIYTHFFGPNYTFTDNCHAQRTEFPGMPRTYTNWKSLGEENAISRIPLGVHFRMDCVEGLRIGREVSRNVLALPWGQ